MEFVLGRAHQTRKAGRRDALKRAHLVAKRVARAHALARRHGVSLFGVWFMLRPPIEDIYFRAADWEDAARKAEALADYITASGRRCGYKVWSNGVLKNVGTVRMDYVDRPE